MLGSLKTSVDDGELPNQEDTSDFSATENPKFLTDRQQICRLLCQLRSSDALIFIEIPGLQKHYATSLLEVDEQNGFILLDELNPKGGDWHLQKAGRCNILANFQGVEVSCSIIGAENVGENELICYRIDVPDRVYYPQRRNTPRLALSASNAPPFTGIATSTDLPLKGDLFDISIKGIGLLLAGKPPMEIGDRITGCQIVLPEEQKIGFDLEVKCVNPNHQQDHLRIGALFDEIGPKDRRELQRFLIEAERAKLKRDL